MKDVIVERKPNTLNFYLCEFTYLKPNISIFSPSIKQKVQETIYIFNFGLFKSKTE